MGNEQSVNAVNQKSLSDYYSARTVPSFDSQATKKSGLRFTKQKSSCSTKEKKENNEKKLKQKLEANIFY